MTTTTLPTELNETLYRFEAHYMEHSENYALVCTECGEELCDIETGDTFDVLVRMILGHECEDPIKPKMGWMSCVFEFDDFDANGDAYYNCIVHGMVTMGREVSCENAGEGDVDLPEGYRWATADESEEHTMRPNPKMIVVPRTVDASGAPYTQGEADLALPIKEEK